MEWNVVSAIAAVISTVAFILSALYVRQQLVASEKDRFLNVTSELFAIFQSDEFMKAQMWLLYKMPERSWEEFLHNHRADAGEIAFHRVGSFYDRVGTLIRLKLINEKEILSTMGGYAIAVWQRIEPFVKEARRIENSVLFDDFESMLPSCYECYVPALGPEKPIVKPFSVDENIRKITPKALKRKLDAGNDTVPLDVRQASHAEQDPRILPGAIYIPPTDIAHRYPEIPPNKEICLYCA